MQFQSCDSSSYCTVVGENGCIVIVFCQLRDSNMVRRWCGKFTESRTTVHDEYRSGRSSLVTLELMESVWQAVFQNRCFTISELSGQFLQMSRYCCTKSSPVAGKRFHDDGEVLKAVTSCLRNVGGRPL